MILILTSEILKNRYLVEGILCANIVTIISIYASLIVGKSLEKAFPALIEKCFYYARVRISHCTSRNFEYSCLVGARDGV